MRTAPSPARARRLAAVAGLVAAALLLGGCATPDDVVTPDDAATPGAVVAPTGATEAFGIPVGPDGVAGAIGDAAPEAVTVQVYFDFRCPYCAMFEVLTAEELGALRASGDVVVEYHPVAILDRYAEGTRFSTRSATAAAFVADRAPDRFLDFQFVMLANQPGEGSIGMTDEQIAAFATEAGVPKAVAAAIGDGSYVSGPDSFEPWVVAGTERAGQDLERLAVPAIVVDGALLDVETYPWNEPGMLTAAVDAARSR